MSGPMRPLVPISAFMLCQLSLSTSAPVSSLLVSDNVVPHFPTRFKLDLGSLSARAAEVGASRNEPKTLELLWGMEAPKRSCILVNIVRILARWTFRIFIQSFFLQGWQ